MMTTLIAPGDNQLVLGTEDGELDVEESNPYGLLAEMLGHMR